jgi:hypothetical protein
LKRTEEEIEAAARALVPFAYGAFEDQGKWDEATNALVDRPPAGTPKQRAREAAEAALAAADGVREARQATCMHFRKAGSSATDLEGNVKSYWYCPDCGMAHHEESWVPPQTQHVSVGGRGRR